MEEVTNEKRPVVISFIIYTGIALVTVLSAWIINLHRFDLSLTISRYVALRPWTAITYGICIAFLVALIVMYVKKMKILLLRKIIYFLTFTSVLGCAVFPFNSEWSIISSRIHNYCAYSLMFLMVASFVVLLITGRKGQKFFALFGILYAVFFIIAFLVIGWQWFYDTIFIWENLFIYLLLSELWLEKNL
ncbi:MAG: hypothetical protein IK014_04710 [Lachnospiraceae bacterium]|nr:hypothetical protein [Lachnospiraceae bacterium]